MAKKLIKTIALDLTVFAMLMTALMFFPNGIFSGFGITADATWDGTTIAKAFDGGDGSEAAPFQIANGEQLAYFAQQVNSGESYEGKYLKLTYDIDLGGKEWTPIGPNYQNPFKGSFNGNGRTISNFTINKPSEDYVGLFGINYGTIMNLAVEGGEVNGGNWVGGICGRNKHGTIYCCSFDGTVTATLYYSGGICGSNDENDCTISNCFNSGNIKGKGTVGGICGVQFDGSISYCISVGTVDGTLSQRGGVIGNKFDVANLDHCYYDYEVCKVPDNYAVGYKENAETVNFATSAELCNGDAMKPFIDSGIWEYGTVVDSRKSDSRLGKITYTYIHLIGVGEKKTREIPFYNFSTDTNGAADWQTYVPITTAEEFLAIKNTLSGNYVLMDDIDLENAEIEPLGTGSFGVTFKFSGNGHTISNFKINKPDGMFVGLFDMMDTTDSLIMNLAVENGEIVGDSHVGGICGFGSDGTIYACSFDGKVTGTSDNSIVGGICGRVMNGKITNCFSSAEVTGEGSVGGVVGENRSGSVQYCISSGTVSGTDNNVGGVAGSKGSSATIDHCYYDYEVCEVPDDYAVGEEANDYDTNCVGSLTTTALCSGDETAMELFTDNGLWEAGSIPTDVTGVNGRFGKKKYTYIHPKDIGTAKTIDVSVYNFSEYIDNPEWKTYTPISTAAEFQKITDLSKNYVLGADIDLGGEEITPIGDLDNSFTGKFSGNGHTVSNFKINRQENLYLGLFGYNKGTIMNLGVEKAEVSGTTRVGGVCGVNIGKLQNCYNTGAVSGTQYVGGVCGANSGTIQNCYNTGAVSGTEYVGGVCGYNDGGTIQSTIQNCYNTGAVKGEYNIGGVCGYKYGGTITNCYYNTDFCTVGGIEGSDVAGSATGLTTLQMTDVNALKTMKFDSEWSKKANDKDGIAYYPSLMESGYQPSVKFTKKLELEQVGDKTPAYGDKIEFRTKALLTFINAFGGEDITVADTAGVFEVNVDREPLSVTDNKFEYTANTAGEVTFTLVYKDGSSDYFPEEYSEDVVVTIEQKELTAADFTFAPAADLEFDNTAKEVTVTAIPNGVGEITVKYYAGDNETQPINAGVYTVKIDVAMGDFYKSAQDLTAADWTFTIAKGTQSVTADDVTLTYGETGKITASTNGDGTISYSVKTGDDVISVADDGTITTMKAGTATVEITAAETANYAPSTKTVNVTVSKVSVTIIANSYTIKVGAALPDFDYEVTGLVNGEKLPIKVTISCTADGKTAGEFPITVSGAADSDNYTFSYTNGTLIVSNKETQTITADDVTLTYGETGKITASTNGDGAISYAVTAGSDVISVATDGTITALKAGTATVEITAAETDRYAKAAKTVNVTVNKAVVTITAKNYTVKTGSALPTFEYTVTGLVNGDTLAFVPNITCAAKDTSTVGAYDIIAAVSITEDERYTYTTQNGTLTIERNSTPVGPIGPVGPNIPTNPTTPANSDVQRNPNEPQIKGENGKSGWNIIANEIKSANDGDIITVDMNGTTELPKKILETIKGKDIDIVLDMGNGFAWTINGNDVKNTQSVDMSVSKGAKIPVRVLNKVTGENSYIAISLKHNGNFGFKAVLTVELSKKNKGLYANLYYYNSKTKKTEFIGADKIGSDGKADLDFTHASDYVIVLDKANHGKPVVTATAMKNSIKLKWNAVSGATKYRVYKIVNGKARLVIETTKHGLNINKAKSDTEYQYIVRAYIDGSWTSMKKSDIVTIKTK